MSLARTGLRSLSRNVSASARAPVLGRRYGSGGAHFNEPTGWLWGNKPAPKGKSHKAESWEPIYFIGMSLCAAHAYYIYIYNPDNREKELRKEALRRMHERGELPTFESSAESKPVVE